MHGNALDCVQYWQLTGNSGIPCNTKDAVNLRFLRAGRDEEGEERNELGDFFTWVAHGS